MTLNNLSSTTPVPDDADNPAGADGLLPFKVDDIDSISSQLRSRSPHPYLLRRPQLQSSRSGLHLESSDTADSRLAGWDGHEQSSGNDSRKALFGNKRTATSTESGTEADDEGYGSAFVRALPPPPLRPRKGLKSSNLAGEEEALLTPTQLDEDAKKFAIDYFGFGQAKLDGRHSTDEDIKVARAKFIRRRRAELLRRAAETGLLAIMGFLVLSQPAVRQAVWHWKRELAVHFSVIAVLYALYPLRLIAHSWNSAPLTKPFRARIRVPAAFDPAPLMYPALLPLLCSISISTGSSKHLLANLILGLASLPAAVIPQGWSNDGYSLHWLLSSLPLFLSKDTNGALQHRLHTAPVGRTKNSGLDPEIAILLFPLHQALLHFLHPLVTTSLLPTELQLLSVSLINLLLFSTSPQAVILSAMLWMGALSIFVFLGPVITWGIMLARIPRWRLRKTPTTEQPRPNIIETLLLRLSKNSPRRRARSLSSVDSDADEDDNEAIHRRPSLSLDTFKAELLSSLRASFFYADDAETKSATETCLPAFSDAPSTKHTRRRRYTLPILNGSANPQSSPSRAKRRKRVLPKSLPQSYLSMTAAQANTRKWIYASYVYTGILLMILGPLRYLISQFALDGNEPIGWVLGYLLGNIRPLRFEIFNWGLDSWISLPPLPDYDFSATSLTLGRADFLRTVVLGEANTRLAIFLWWILILVVGLSAVILVTIVEVDTRRKVFHGMMVGILLPTIFVDPAFISLVLALVLAVFFILELIRTSQLPPLSKPIAYFLTPYVDGRDLRGPVVVSHIFLLIGCAAPLWLSLASEHMVGERPWRGWELGQRDVSMISGVVCVGMGDAAASLIGRRYGRRKWPWAGGKSLEGSAAFALTVVVGLSFAKLWLWYGQWPQRQAAEPGEAMAFKIFMTLRKAAVAGCGASFTEAVLTGGNDNVIVPVVLWLFVRALGL